MKFLVFCFVIVANISTNGRASLDSFSPSSTNVLLEDTTINSDRSCDRPCKLNVKPRRCHYRFKIEPTFKDDGKPVLTINGMTPGPPIHVCMNDIIVVEVQNKVADQDLTMHWHGVEQKGTPYMDGVPMVTQCPIGFGSTYKYAFRASSPGTYFYHSDSVLHQSDGVYGALIITQPQPLEPHSTLYDYDRATENTLIVAVEFLKLLSGSLGESDSIVPTNLVINGDEDVSKILVMSGFSYRIRLINAIAVECPVVMEAEEHELLIISADGKPVKPIITKYVKLYPGERMDVVLRAAKENGGYCLHVRGAGACAGLHTAAMLLYSGYNNTAVLRSCDQQKDMKNQAEPAISGEMLESYRDASYVADVRKFYLGINKNVVKYWDADNDYRYVSDAIPKKPFYPATLSVREGSAVQINGKSFLYPNAPILLRPRDVRADAVCAVGEEVAQQEPQCIQVLNALEDETLELALVNEGFGSNDSYTFHLHGYSMQIVASWQNPSRTPITQQEYEKMDYEGRVQRNLLTPVLKDTVVVPNKGFTIVRIRLDHTGSWMFECRSCGISSLPTGLIINVPQVLPNSVLNSLPKCGNYRPPDVLLN